LPVLNNASRYKREALLLLKGARVAPGKNAKKNNFHKERRSYTLALPSTTLLFSARHVHTARRALWQGDTRLTAVHYQHQHA